MSAAQEHTGGIIGEVDLETFYNDGNKAWLLRRLRLQSTPAQPSTLLLPRCDLAAVLHHAMRKQLFSSSSSGCQHQNFRIQAVYVACT